MKQVTRLGILLLSVLIPGALLAATVYVPSDASSISNAIAGVTDGDTVVVEPGTYHEHGIDFLGKGIVVTGPDPEDSLTVAATIVDGDAAGSVFMFQTGEDSSSVLNGLTITNGLSSLGGGVYCDAASPTISRNIIRNNSAPGLQPDGRGGGIFSFNSQAIIRENIIAFNSSGNKGGGIMADSSSPLIVNNVLRENISYLSGGAIRVYESAARIHNHLIVGNHTDYHGGGISTHVSSATAIVNNTLVGNSVDYSGGGGGVTSTGNPEIINCIVWGNSPKSIDGGPTVSYSDIEGGFSGAGNIGLDPLFFEPFDGSYQVQPGSPCVDSGDPTIEDACLPPGLGGTRSDMGAYGGEEDDPLQVHHVEYRLFRELLFDVMTVCRPCHRRIHENSLLRFPPGMDVEHVERLGFERPEFAAWLLPRSARSPQDAVAASPGGEGRT